MKKIFIAALAVSFVFTSCNNTSTTTKNDSQEEKNLAANKAITKAFETGDVSAIDSVVSDDFIDHTDRGDMKGKDSLKAAIKWIHANMKGMKMETVREVADGEYVWSWMKYTGESDGSMGMPKGPYNMEAIELSKYKDGKAIEHWSFMEVQDAIKMFAPASAKHATDTTKK